jgi:drug/metabolite transporter (DMT)-like permease
MWVGLVLFGADYGLIYWGEQYIESGLTAILFATLPLITIFFAHVYVPGDRITKRKMAGTILAFLGVVSLFANSVRLDPSKSLPMLAIIASAVCAAASAVATKRYGHALHPASLTATAMLVGAVILTGMSLASGEGFGVPSDAQTWGAILYLALAGSVFTFMVYFTLLKTWSVTSLSFISVFTPAIALALGFLVLGERLTIWTAIGAVLILAGVTLALALPAGPHRNQIGSMD